MPFRFVGEELEAKRALLHLFVFFFLVVIYIALGILIQNLTFLTLLFFMVVLDDWVASVSSSAFWARENWM